ncbi:hypothetical protein [Nonomuraea sp. NPDC049141]|uniref:hypothetical protein n=1 Tax=Nonomuraea sp. NPDC049141 TaxID=3155500 RepID=UPI003405445D
MAGAVRAVLGAARPVRVVLGPVMAARPARGAPGVVRAAARPVKAVLGVVRAARPVMAVAGAVRTVARLVAAVRAEVVAVAGVRRVAGRGGRRVIRRAMPPSTSCEPSTSATRTPTC